MTGTVGDKGDEVQVLALLASQQAVDGLDDDLDDVDVLPLVEAADIISLGNLTLMEDEVDGTGVVLHVEPVAHVLSLAVDRQRLTVADVVDKERYQLLRELVGTVVVRAVGHHHRHAVGIVEGTHKMVGAGLGSAVGRVRIVLRGLQEELVAVGQVVLRARCRRGEGRFDALRMRQLQCAIHLVGRDVVEALALILLRQALPVELGSLQQRERTHHIGLCKGEGVFDRAVYVALGSQMDDAVYLLVLHQLQEGVEVADVHLHKLVVGLLLNVLQVGQVAGIGQLVQIDDVVVRVLVHKQAHHMASYKACATSNNDCSFHIYFFIKLLTHFLRESVQYGTLTPKVSFTLVLSKTE